MKGVAEVKFSKKAVQLILLMFFVSIVFFNYTAPAAFAEKPQDKEKTESAKTKESGSSKSSFKPFKEVIEDTQKVEGLFTLYQAEDGQVYLEILPGQLNTLFQMTIALSKGIGDQGLVSGLPLDDYVFQFHRVNKEVQFIKKNVYFTARQGTPLERAVKTSFTDSILANLKIVSIHPDKKSLLVDAAELFLSDVPNVSRILNLALKAHYSLDSSKSSVKKIESFPLNTEVEVESDFASSAPPKEAAFLNTLPDWRNVPLGVHYSFSTLPKESYTPRISDDRVGYFTTDMKDFSSKNLETPIVRYIYRWNLAKKPVVFWIENTIPLEYRDVIKEGILEWNKAFSGLGITQALDVKIQPDDAGWSSSDIRYNMIRWVAPSENKFAGVGPSHVNPLTGEIYNASVLIDAESIRRLKMVYVEELNLGNESDFKKSFAHLGRTQICTLPRARAQEAKSAALAVLLSSVNASGFKVPESFIQGYFKELVMHEVGHCLGLRHNFHASTYHSLKELQDPSVTGKTGLAASVMDYLPINIAPPGEKQGEYFSSTIGPYDYWAIEYGYVPMAVPVGSTSIFMEGEESRLKKIASRSTEPGHEYSTDEDVYSPFHVDPTSMPFDLSSDSLGFVEGRFRLYQKLIKDISEKLPFPGESFSQKRRIFDLILSGYANYSAIPVNHLGGFYFHRNHKGDPNAQPPLRPVAKKKQMTALDLLDQHIFSEPAFTFSPNLLNQLAPDRNSDHFSDLFPLLTPFDYPILEKVSRIQEGILKEFFRPVLLNRLLDNERKVNNPQETLTLADFLEWMTSHFWKEVDRSASIRDTRRNLQRVYIQQLARLVVQPKPQYFAVPELEIPPVPIASVLEDARSLAAHQLEQIRAKIQRALKLQKNKMDTASLSHLQASLRIIEKILNSKLNQALEEQSPGPPEQE